MLGKTCRICGGTASSLGTVQFDRNNEGVKPVSDKYMEYHVCNTCDHVFCEEMLDWSPEKLASEVYNAEYVNYDLDYGTGIRSKNFYHNMRPLLNTKLTHLDYGSGGGHLVDLMRRSVKISEGYDPFSSPTRPEGKFNFITAIEVFEHSQNIESTLEDVRSFMDRDSVVLYTTLYFNKDSDNINWWYIGARNGHISIMSTKSMSILAKRLGLFNFSIDNGLHMLTRTRNSPKDILGLSGYRKC